MLIYKITNDVNNKLYIGQTTKPLEERIRNHRNSFVSGSDTRIYRAMRKYGWDKFHFEVIATAKDKATLDELEKYFIEKYDSVNNGYNMSFGGDNNPMFSDEVAEKHSSIMRSDAVRKKISESMKRSYAKRGGPSEEHRKHLSNSRYALYASEKGEEVRRKFRESFKLSPEHFKALNDAKNKSVYCLNTDGEVVAEFHRVKDAADWWHKNGYDNVKSSDQLNDRIKESAKQEKYIRGLKWVYRV